MKDSNCEVPRRFNPGQVATLTLRINACTLILVNLTRIYMVPHIHAQLRSCRNTYLRVAQGTPEEFPKHTQLSALSPVGFDALDAFQVSRSLL
jgi:hypothetical protein